MEPAPAVVDERRLSDPGRVAAQGDRLVLEALVEQRLVDQRAPGRLLDRDLHRPVARPEPVTTSRSPSPGRGQLEVDRDGLAVAEAARRGERELQPRGADLRLLPALRLRELGSRAERVPAHDHRVAEAVADVDQLLRRRTRKAEPAPERRLARGELPRVVHPGERVGPVGDGWRGERLLPRVHGG